MEEKVYLLNAFVTLPGCPNVHVAPCWHLFYDEDGYCTKCIKCVVPEDVSAKLAEANK